jgi:hypothetical protein
MKAHVLGVLASMVILAAAPALAHHPFAAEFDSKKPVTITGTITKVDWSNPHAVLHLDEKKATGEVTNWTIELGGPGALTRRGWNQTSVKSGDQVTVQGWLARDGSKRANADTVSMSDGHKLSAASSFREKAKKTSTH